MSNKPIKILEEEGYPIYNDGDYYVQYWVLYPDKNASGCGLDYKVESLVAPDLDKFVGKRIRLITTVEILDDD